MGESAGWGAIVLLATIAWHLLQKSRAALTLLRDRPERMESAVAGMLRFDAPCQTIARFPARDTTANRDEKVFPDLDRFDIIRVPTRQA